MDNFDVFVINNVHTGANLPSTYLRTAVLVKVVTVVGQSVFLRGGISHGRRTGLNVIRSDTIYDENSDGHQTNLYPKTTRRKLNDDLRSKADRKKWPV